MGHLSMENRNGLTVDALVTEATGTAERAATLAMLGRQTAGTAPTLGADGGLRCWGFGADLRVLNPAAVRYRGPEHLKNLAAAPIPSIQPKDWGRQRPYFRSPLALLLFEMQGD